jgi:hypothetical protein
MRCIRILLTCGLAEVPPLATHLAEEVCCYVNSRLSLGKSGSAMLEAMLPLLISLGLWLSAMTIALWVSARP